MVSSSFIALILSVVGMFFLVWAVRDVFERKRRRRSVEVDAEPKVDIAEAFRRRGRSREAMEAYCGSDDFYCNYGISPLEHYLYFMEGVGWPNVRQVEIGMTDSRFSYVMVRFKDADIKAWFWKIPNKSYAHELKRMFESVCDGDAKINIIVSRARSRSRATDNSNRDANIAKYGYSWSEKIYESR